MTASLNLASIAAPGQASPLGSAPTGAAAGFDLLLAAFFGEEGQAMDPALAGLLGTPAAGTAPTPGAAVEDVVAAEAGSGEAKPVEGAVEQASAEAALALLTVVTAAETPAAAPAAVAPEVPVEGEGAAWGREKLPGVPAQPALDHANPKAELDAKAAAAPAHDPAAATPGRAAEAHAQHKPQPVAPATEAAPPAAAPAATTAAAATDPAASALAAAEVAPEAPKPLKDKPAKVDKAKAEPAAAARTEASAPGSPARTGAEVVVGAAKPDSAKTAGLAGDRPAAAAAEATPAAADTPEPAVAAAPAQAAEPEVPAALSATAPVRGSPETVAALAAQIVKKLEGRSSRFDLELHPADLGRVDVRLEINAQGRLTAAMSFDTPQAAAELKSRAAELQRALEQAGFDLSGGMSFDVAHDRGGQGFPGHAAQDREGFAGFRGRAFQAALETAGEADVAVGGLQLRQGVRSGVDVKI